MLCCVAQIKYFSLNLCSLSGEILLLWQKCASAYVINAKSGLCPEDCHYCLQYKILTADIERYPLVSQQKS